MMLMTGGDSLLLVFYFARGPRPERCGLHVFVLSTLNSFLALDLYIFRTTLGSLPSTSRDHRIPDVWHTESSRPSSLPRVPTLPPQPLVNDQ